jgi:hypothetical protein
MFGQSCAKIHDETKPDSIFDLLIVGYSWEKKTAAVAVWPVRKLKPTPDGATLDTSLTEASRPNLTGTYMGFCGCSHNFWP